MNYCRTALVGFSVVALVSSGARGGPLRVVEVSAPAINYVYNPSGKVVVSDSTAKLEIPGATATGWLQSRTFMGVSNAPLAYARAYEYRVNLAPATATNAWGGTNGFVSLTIPFHNRRAYDYNRDGTNDDVFVVTKGGLGNVRIASATEVTNNIITFTFARPVCPARGRAPGDSTFFFGMSGSEAPTNATVTLRDRLGGVHVVNAVVSP